MAKKPDSKGKSSGRDDETKTAKSAEAKPTRGKARVSKSAAGGAAQRPAAAKSAGKSASARRAKRDTRAPALTGLSNSVAALTKSSGKGSGKKKGQKGSKKNALKFMPEMGGDHGEVLQTAREIGGQIMSVLNTDAGRVIAAEVLIYLAKSLTKAAASTEMGKDASASVLNAGAKIGAAMASAGARAMEAGTDAAEAGAGAASDAAISASGLAREVAQVAVSAVGGVVLDTAAKVMRKRGKSGDKPQGQPAPGQPGTSDPVNA